MEWLISPELLSFLRVLDSGDLEDSEITPYDHKPPMSVGDLKVHLNFFDQATYHRITPVFVGNITRMIRLITPMLYQYYTSIAPWQCCSSTNDTRVLNMALVFFCVLEGSHRAWNSVFLSPDMKFQLEHQDSWKCSWQFSVCFQCDTSISCQHFRDVPLLQQGNRHLMFPLPPGKLTWQWTIDHEWRCISYKIKRGIFHCYCWWFRNPAITT